MNFSILSSNVKKRRKDHRYRKNTIPQALLLLTAKKYGVLDPVDSNQLERIKCHRQTKKLREILNAAGQDVYNINEVNAVGKRTVWRDLTIGLVSAVIFAFITEFVLAYALVTIEPQSTFFMRPSSGDAIIPVAIYNSGKIKATDLTIGINFSCEDAMESFKPWPIKYDALLPGQIINEELKAPLSTECAINKRTGDLMTNIHFFAAPDGNIVATYIEPTTTCEICDLRFKSKAYFDWLWFNRIEIENLTPPKRYDAFLMSHPEITLPDMVAVLKDGTKLETNKLRKVTPDEATKENLIKLPNLSVRVTLYPSTEAGNILPRIRSMECQQNTWQEEVCIKHSRE